MFQCVLFRDNVLKHARYNYETKSDLTFPKFGLIIFKTVLGPPIFSEYLKILREKNQTNRREFWTKSQILFWHELGGFLPLNISIQQYLRNTKFRIQKPRIGSDTDTRTIAKIPDPILLLITNNENLLLCYILIVKYSKISNSKIYEILQQSAYIKTQDKQCIKMKILKLVIQN